MPRRAILWQYPHVSRGGQNGGKRDEMSLDLPGLDWRTHAVFLDFDGTRIEHGRYLDTLVLAREGYPDLENYRLDTLSRFFFERTKRRPSPGRAMTHAERRMQIAPPAAMRRHVVNIRMTTRQ